MTPIRFNPEKDLAPMPFSERICRQALDLKSLGLDWHPHVGCFVWDPDGIIKAASPFPGRIYFILSLPRFIDIFGSIDKMVEKLVWLPTWNQGRILCEKLKVASADPADERQTGRVCSPDDDLLRLYQRIGEALQKRTAGDQTS